MGGEIKSESGFRATIKEWLTRPDTPKPPRDPRVVVIVWIGAVLASVPFWTFWIAGAIRHKGPLLGLGGALIVNIAATYWIVYGQYKLADGISLSKALVKTLLIMVSILVATVTSFVLAGIVSALLIGSYLEVNYPDGPAPKYEGLIPREHPH